MRALVTPRLRLEPLSAEAGATLDGARPAALPAWAMMAILAEGVKVGEGGLLFEDEAEVHLGYRIEEPFRRRGYAVEALSAIVALAFERLGLASLHAEAACDNVASQRTLARLDFVDTGARSTRWSKRRQSYIDYHLYRLDRADRTPAA